MNERMGVLDKNNTWELVPPPQRKRAIRYRWMFTVKHNADGLVDRYKARLVSNGYTQTYDVIMNRPFLI